MITLWDAATGEEAYRFACGSGKVLSMAVCGENLIATGGSDNVVRIWNWQTQSETEHFVGHTGSVATMAFDPQSNAIISGSFDTTARVWQLERPEPQDTANGKKIEFRVR